jgi:threonine dehydrogenase-like Zn-dependent dehydrogenase
MSQAEYARIPFADNSLVPVPVNASTNETTLFSYLFITDIFSTAWSGLTWSGFQRGDSVAVFGAGPVGLLAAYSAVLRGASRVYIVDDVQQRLNLGASIGAVPINFNTSDPVEQILALEPMGVRRGVEAVGASPQRYHGLDHRFAAARQCDCQSRRYRLCRSAKQWNLQLRHRHCVQQSHHTARRYHSASTGCCC